MQDARPNPKRLGLPDAADADQALQDYLALRQRLESLQKPSTIKSYGQVGGRSTAANVCSLPNATLQSHTTGSMHKLMHGRHFTALDPADCGQHCHQVLCRLRWTCWLP
jgi:hypothetical protein